MNIILSQSLLFIVFGVLSLAIVVGIITLVYYHMLKKYAKLEQDLIGAEEMLSQQMTSAIDLTEQNVGSVLTLGKTKADQLINQAQGTQEQVKNEVINALETFSLEQLNLLRTNYQSIFAKYNLPVTKLKDYPINNSLNVSKYIEEATSASIERYEEIYREVALQMQKTLEEHIAAAVKISDEVVKDQQKTKLKEVDGEIVKIISNVLNRVTTKVISVTEHEDLVLEALENAKKEGKLA